MNKNIVFGSLIVLLESKQIRKYYFDILPRITSDYRTQAWLAEAGGLTMEGYNVLGDGTVAALAPLLTGLTEWQLPEIRRRIKSSQARNRPFSQTNKKFNKMNKVLSL